MAPNIVTKPTQMSFFLLLVMTTICLAKDQNLRETSMVVYFQDVSAGANATVVPITGIQGKIWSFAQFGTIFGVDDPITLYPDPNSPMLGRAQGIFVTSALDGSNALALISIVFTNVQYRGSTLEIHGTNRQFERIRELAVISGTGIFRLARGYAVLETIYFDAMRSYAIVRCNITLSY